MTDPMPARRLFTAKEARIAQLIADDRNLSYAQIGTLMDPPIAENTVKAYVRGMALCFGPEAREAYPPRIQILMWVRRLQWNLGHLPHVSELIDASADIGDG